MFCLTNSVWQIYNRHSSEYYLTYSNQQDSLHTIPQDQDHYRNCNCWYNS